MTHFPKVGIIFLTYPTPNWERDINRCLSSFERLNYPKDRLELICVESKAKIPPITDWFARTWMPKSGVELPRITYIVKDEWIGFSGNNNLGYAKAKELGCDYVHLINEDTDVDQDCILRAVEKAESDERIALVQSLILLGEARDTVNSVGNAFHYLGFGYSKGYTWTKERALQSLKGDEIGYASGAAVLARVKAVDEAGGLFDEKFFSYHEDTDLTLKTRIRGWKTVIEPQSIVYHYYEFAKSKINYYWMERNRYVLIFSYYRLWTLIALFPMMLVMDLALLLFSITGGWSGMKLKVYVDWVSPEFWRWIKTRRRSIQSARKISDRELLTHAVPTIEFQERSVENPVLRYVGNPLLKMYLRLLLLVIR